MKLALAFFLNLFLLITLIYPAPGKEIRKDYHQQYNVMEGVTLHLISGDGEVSVTTWDKDVLDISVIYRAKVKSIGLGKKHDFKVDFRKRGNDIYVAEQIVRSFSFGILYDNQYEYRYIIQAPRYLKLDLEGEDGNVEIEGLTGEIDCRIDDGNLELRRIITPLVRIRFADGNVSLKEVESELEIRGEDGSISLKNCKIPRASLELEDGNIFIRDSGGNFKIDTYDGNVKMVRTHLKEATIRTEDGGVDLDLLKSKNLDLTVRTTDGYVTVDLEGGTSAAFNIHTGDGSIRTSLTYATVDRHSRHAVSGRLYNGEGRIRISTVDGSITLREQR